MWKRPAPRPIASLEVASKFNDQVELDLLFIDRLIICHMVCRCIRWHVGDFIPDKLAKSIIHVIDQRWVRQFGPMRELIVDGETSLGTDEALQFFNRHGIVRVPKAPSQHAHIIERRGAVLREQWHRSKSQMQEEGLNVDNDLLLSECIMAGNCLVAVGGTTPYNALFGRQPGILPELPALAGHGGRDAQRVREIAVQQMVEGTARAKVQRAMRTATRPTAEDKDFKVGDSVEFYRPPSSKDTPGWNGPARVTDTTDQSRGNIGIKWQGRLMICRIQDLRHELAMWCMIAHADEHPSGGAWDFLRHFVEQMPPSQQMTLGLVHSGVWALSADTMRYLQVFHAAVHYADVGLQLRGTTAVRLGRGCGSLSAKSGYHVQVLLWWFAGSSSAVYTHETTMTAPIKFRQLAGDRWPQVCFIQWLVADECTALQAQNEITAVQQHQLAPSHVGDVADRQADRPSEPAGVPTPPAAQGQLTPIPEGTEPSDTADGTTNVTDDDAADLTNMLTIHDDFNDPVIMDELIKGLADMESEMVDVDPAEPDMCGHWLPDYDIESLKLQLPELEAHNEKVYIEFPAEFGKLLEDTEHDVDEGQVYAMSSDAVTRKKVIVSRDSDLLTPQEIKDHASEVAQAMLKELATWQKYNCFARRPRRGARNVIDCRWVLKWKVTDDGGPDPSGRSASRPAGSAGDGGKPTREIRARLTVRGFKDMDAASLESYAGTSTKWSQRLVASFAVQRQWRIVSADVAKAFLQGISYEELAKLTGAPLRVVCFELPLKCIPLLKQLPGFEDFNPAEEVLECTKPGTGLRDAPKAFGIRLGQTTRDNCGLQSVTPDPEMEVLHKDGEPILIICKHVDDIKMAGSEATIKWLIRELEAVFGPLTVNWDNFTNCGIRHALDVRAGTLTMDQSAYIAALRPIVHRDLVGARPESLLEGELYTMFRSLLGAIAWCNMTRCDIMVYVVALQRAAHQPTVLHARRLNAVVRYAQRNPKGITYRPLTGPLRLLTVSDSSFKKEEDDAHAMKGVFILLAAGGEACKADGGVHILDYAARKQQHVTRSTFAAELFSACDGIDHALLISIAMHEILRGCSGTAEARRLREEGGLCFELWLAIDAMSVLAAVSAEAVRPPAEKSLLGHLLWIRELADRGLLTGISWVDTRDMLSDGLTKGSVDRELIHRAMDGHWRLAHEPKAWSSQLARRREA